MGNYRSARGTLVNRTIWARVTHTSGIAVDLVKSSLQDWGFEVIEEKSKKQLVIFVRVYSAKSAALQVARREIQKFSRCGINLTVEDIKLHEEERSQRKTVYLGSFNKKRSLQNSDFIRRTEVRPKNVSRLVFIERSEDDDLKERRKEEIARAEAVLRQWNPGGHSYGRVKDQIYFPVEPKKTYSSDSGSKFRATLTISVLLTFFLAGLAAATIAWLEVPLQWKLLCGIIGVIIAALTGLWIAGDRITIRAKLGAIIPSVLMYFYIGWAINTVVGQSDQLIGVLLNICLVLAIFSICVLLLLGWVHLVNIHPKVKKLWSLSVLAFILPGLYWLNRFFMLDLNSSLGVTGASPDTSIYLKVTSICLLASCILIPLFFVGGFAGWLEYYSIVDEGLIQLIASRLLALFVVLLLVVSGVLVAYKVAVGQVNKWYYELVQGATPALTSDFLYRSCLYPKVEGKGKIELPEKPIPVMKAGDDLWILNKLDKPSDSDSDGQVQFQFTHFSDSPSILSIPVDDFDESCDK